MKRVLLLVGFTLLVLAILWSPDLFAGTAIDYSKTSSGGGGTTVFTQAFLTGDGAVTTPVSPTYVGEIFDINGSSQLDLRDGGASGGGGNGIPLTKLKALSSTRRLVGAGSSNSVVGEIAITTPMAFTGTNLGVNVVLPLTDTPGVSLTADFDKFTLNGSSELDLRFGDSGTLREENNGIGVLMPAQVGGSLFANYNTLNLSGFTVSRSGDVLTVTNAVSVSGSVTGDGSPGNPITVSGSGATIGIQAGGAAFSDAATLNYVGSELSRSGSVTTVTTKVSATAPVTGDGSSGSPVALTYDDSLLSRSGSLSLNAPIQHGGALFTNAKTINLVGFEPTWSGSTLTITNKVSGTAPVTGDGSSGSPLAVATDASILNSGGSFTVNALAQQGGADAARFNTINWVGNELSWSGRTLTVTNKVSSSSPLTGDGSSGSPLDIALTTGLEDLAGSLHLVAVTKDEGGASLGGADTFNVSGTTAQNTFSGTTVTTNITPTTVRAFGVDLGSYAYQDFYNSTVVDAGDGSARITPYILTQDEGGTANLGQTTLNVSSEIANASASSATTTVAVTPTTVRDQAGVDLGSFAYLRFINHTVTAPADGAGAARILPYILTQDEGAATGTAETTVNVSSIQANVASASGVSTVNITPTTVRDVNGVDLGSYAYLQFVGSNASVVDGGDGTARIGFSASGITVTDEGGSSLGTATTVNVSGTPASMTFSSPVGTVNVSPTTVRDQAGVDLGSFDYLRFINSTVTAPADGAGAARIVPYILTQDEGTSTGTAETTVNVSSRMAGITSSSGVSTIAVTPTTIVDYQGVALGQFDYQQFLNSTVVAGDQTGQARITPWIQVQDEGGTASLGITTLNTSGTAIAETVSGATSTIAVVGGTVLQEVTSYTGAGISSAGAYGSGTTAIADDDNALTSTSGDEYIELAMIPYSASSKLVIDADLYFSHSVSSIQVFALLTSGTSVLAGGASNAYKNGATQLYSSIHLSAVLASPGANTPVTILLRAGSTSGTLSVNGQAAGTHKGGSLQSFIKVREELTQ